MDNFNKIVSFILGLVVVIVFLTAIAGRFNLKDRLKGLVSQNKITPTVGTRGYLSPTPATEEAATTPNSIPATGSPSLLLPLVFSMFSLGIYLKKKD